MQIMKSKRNVGWPKVEANYESLTKLRSSLYKEVKIGIIGKASKEKDEHA